MQPKKREGRVVLVEKKRYEKGETSIRSTDIGGGRPCYVGLGIIRIIRHGDDSLCIEG